MDTHRFIVGLTGGIASGKSTVAEHLVALGGGLVDTDRIAHALSAPNAAGALAVARLFGADYLNADGSIARAKLRQRIFQHADDKQQLEAALHPLIYAAARAEIAALTDAPYLILAVPLLLETGTYLPLLDRIAVVDCPADQQIARAMSRSGLTAAEVSAIMAQQMDRASRLARADDVIDNHGDLASLQSAAEDLHRKYLQLAESKNFSFQAFVKSI